MDVSLCRLALSAARSVILKTGTVHVPIFRSRVERQLVTIGRRGMQHKVCRDICNARK